MKPVLLLLLGLLAAPLGRAGYEEKDPPKQLNLEDKPPAGVQQLPPRAGTNEDRYPYYGNVPEEMVPFHTIEPYYRYWTTRLPFRGPGKDYPDPPDLKSLKVGLLSPPGYGPEGARGARTKKGVELAFAEANAARKPGELPFELIAREDSPQWGSAANIAVDFADNEVLGILGTIDGDATHVALRVALKIETYIINTSDPDPTLTETQIPWLMRVLPDQRQESFLLAEVMVRERGCKRIAIFRESSRPGRVGVMHFVNFIRRLGYPPVQHLLFRPGDTDIAMQIQAIKAADVDAVFFCGQPDDIGRFAAQFRQAGIKAQFFGFDRLEEDSFRQSAGSAAEGTTIAYYYDPNRTDQPWRDFVARYEKRYGEKPDSYAAYGYDGAHLMIQAIEHAGPNRWRVRDYLAGLDSYDGVTGHMVFDGRWDNIAPMVLGEFHQGAWHFRPAPPMRQEERPTITQR
jgi:branched-chain amino acid transport system substrate-binding protein